MSCNSCAKAFTFLRKEKGCPGCGFSYCSSCLDHQISLNKSDKVSKVCFKCKQKAESNAPTAVVPPDALLRRLEKLNEKTLNKPSSSKDHEIEERLNKLKNDPVSVPSKTATDDEIAQRLNKIKELPQTSTAEIEKRLAKLRGIQITESSKASIPLISNRKTEQEEADELMQRYLSEVEIDTVYKDGFNQKVADIESRLLNLQNTATAKNGEEKEMSEDEILKASEQLKSKPKTEQEEADELMQQYLSEVEKHKDGFSQKVDNIESRLLNLQNTTTIKKLEEKEMTEDEIIKKVLQASIEEKETSCDDELPFCEICNEDATLRCLGCKYLFCKRCYNDHRDDDDECNKYVPYKPPK